jgi:tRNA dimethylallyltransferase
MIDAGALDEVRALLALDIPSDRPLMRALGLPHLAGYLAGKIDLDQALNLAITATRQYAKRQDTWFRHQFIADFTLESQFSENLEAEIFAFIRQTGLTLKV